MFKYAALTHQGKVRGNNEDNFYIDDKWKKNAEDGAFAVDGEINGSYLLSAVFDGMGGEDLGEIASLRATECLHHMFGHEIKSDIKSEEIIDKKNIFERVFQKKNKRVNESDISEDAETEEPIKRLLQSNPMWYVKYANMRICEEIKKRQTSMGTTFVGIEFFEESAVVINIGDSPAYRYHNEKLELLSVEHSPIGSLIRDGLITREEAKKHPLRNKISQYLGIFEEEMELVPSITERIPLEKGDQYLLCSDGLTNMLTEDEIISVISEPKDIKEKTRNLVQNAIDKGGKDNITVVIIEIC